MSSIIVYSFLAEFAFVSAEAGSVCAGLQDERASVVMEAARHSI
jgi:hypothetical protein